MKAPIINPQSAFIVLVLLATAFAIGRGCRSEAPTPAPTGIEYRDRPLSPKDTAKAAAPVSQTRFRKVKPKDTRRDTVAVPIDSPPLTGMTTERPIQVGPGHIILTRWRPDSLRWEQERYEIPPPRLSATVTAVGGLSRALDTEGAFGPLRPAVGLVAAVRYKRVSVRGTAMVSQSEAGAVGSVGVGVGFELWGWRR